MIFVLFIISSLSLLLVLDYNHQNETLALSESTPPLMKAAFIDIIGHYDGEVGSVKFDPEELKKHRWTLDRQMEHFNHWILATEEMFTSRREEIREKRDRYN